MESIPKKYRLLWNRRAIETLLQLKLHIKRVYFRGNLSVQRMQAHRVLCSRFVSNRSYDYTRKPWHCDEANEKSKDLTFAVSGILATFAQIYSNT